MQEPTSRETTPRRAEVRDLLAKGLTVRQIAAVMHVSTQAVYDHIRKIKAEEEEAVA